jgi:hypothetical protein
VLDVALVLIFTSTPYGADAVITIPDPEEKNMAEPG